MKKYVFLIIGIAIVSLCVVGCFGIKSSSGNNFKANVDDNIIKLTCTGAAKGDTASAYIVLEEDEELVIHTNLEKLEKVNVKVYPKGHSKSDQPLVDLDGYGVNPYSYPLDPGTYEVVFTALHDDLTGSIEVSVE